MTKSEYNITMKNGDVLHVSYEVYSKLSDSMNKGVATFVSFTDNDNDYFLTINVTEIMYIK